MIRRNQNIHFGVNQKLGLPNKHARLYHAIIRLQASLGFQYSILFTRMQGKRSDKMNKTISFKLRMRFLSFFSSRVI